MILDNPIPPVLLSAIIFASMATDVLGATPVLATKNTVSSSGNEAGLPPLSPEASSVITGVDVYLAKWFYPIRKLKITGQILLTPGAKPPEGTEITIGDRVRPKLATVTRIKPNGRWSAFISLDQNLVPCKVQISVNTTPSLTTLRKVAGLERLICIK